LAGSTSDDQVFIQRATRRLITVGVLGVVLYFILSLLRAALTPLAVSFGIAYLLSPLIDWMEARGISRSFAVLLLLIGVVGAAIAAALFLVPRIQHEVSLLVQRLPGYVNAAAASLGPVLEQRFGVELPGTVSEALDRVREIEWKPVLQGLQRAGSQLLGVFTGTLQAVVGVVLIPVLAFYMLVGFPAITSGMRSLVPRGYLEPVLAKLETIDGLLSGFIRGQLLVAAVQGLLYALGFAAIGVPAALLIGLLSGALAIIPYVGGAVAIGTASTMCILEFGVGIELLLVVVWYAIVQALEGFVLTPRIVGESLGLHPVTVIVALMIGGDLLGFLGLLVAVPLVAVVQVFLVDALEAYRGSALYRGEEDTVQAAER